MSEATFGAAAGVPVRNLLRSLVSLPTRNRLRLAFRRHPYELRARYPDLEAVGLSPRDVVIDAGAHRGEFSETVLAFQPRARIHAFEPLPSRAAELARRLAPFGSVSVHQLALASEEGDAEFFVTEYDQASSLLPIGEALERGVFGLDFRTREVLRVRRATLNAFFSSSGIERVALLKLDVQGFELEVLRGGDEVLDRIDWVYAEAQFQELYRGGPRFDETAAFLHARGFDLFRMSSFRFDDTGALLECDMLFHRRLPQGRRR